MSYWELYRADLDSLAQHYSAREHDAGIHVPLGPAECGAGAGGGPPCAPYPAGSWRPIHLATRVVGEPEASNERLIARGRAGFVRVHRPRPTEQAGRPDDRRALAAPSSESPRSRRLNTRAYDH
jgi:hypothetical protein